RWQTRNTSGHSRSKLPLLLPSYVVVDSHWYVASNSCSASRSHIALCDEQCISTYTFLLAPRSSWNSRTRAGGTCASCVPATTSIGVCVFFTTSCVQPKVGTRGARRTPPLLPHVAPTGSDASMSAHTASATCGSY